MTAGAAAGGDAALTRTTAVVTLATALSRLTGFGRTVVMAGVLGASFLGNTYQSANTVPNVLFELLAAGALQAVLVPALVRVGAEEGAEGAGRVAGAVLGALLVGLGAVAALGMVLAPAVMRLLTVGVDDPDVRADQVALGATFLRIFLPQLVMYAVGLVATGALHARHRFVVPALAPAVNNVVVVAAYGLFWWHRDGAAPSLELDGVDVTLLAGGTTLAVLAFTSLPALACRRAGISLRPHLDLAHPEVRRLGRQAGWAAGYLGATQLLLLVVLVVANAAEGGVVAWQVAFTVFLLPHALFSVPVAITLGPALAARAHAADWPGFADRLGAGLRVVAVLAFGSAAALAALAWPLTRLALFGEAAGSGVEPVARAVVAFAPGLAGYGAFQVLSRASFALGDTRTPALVNTAAAAAGAVGMVVAGALAHGDALPAALAGVHSAVSTAGAIALLLLVWRTLPGRPPLRVAAVARAAAGAALVAAAAMVAVAVLVDATSRTAAAAVVAVGGMVGAAVYLGAVRVATGRGPRALVDLTPAAHG